MHPRFIEWFLEQECAPWERFGEYTLIIHPCFVGIRKMNNRI